jgi:hypothetical protein
MICQNGSQSILAVLRWGGAGETLDQSSMGMTLHSKPLVLSVSKHCPVPPIFL